jgi:hypothetical protein
VSGRYRAQVEDAVRAVDVLSATRHAWLGTAGPPLPAHVERQLDAATGRAYLAYNVASALYSNFYCQGIAAPARRGDRGGDARGDGTFVEALSAANCGAGCWEPGWSVAAVSNGSVSVERGGLTLMTPREACREEAGHRVEAGAPVRIRFPKELLRLSPGFYMALGDAALAPDDAVVRLYWHVVADGAVEFVRTATRVLNEAAVPARLKVVNDPRRYDRCDAAVVYIRGDDYPRAQSAVRELLGRVGPRLAPTTPALTKPLAPGLAVAEDPGRGESFGLNRCEAIAEGIVRAHERGRQSGDERMATVAEALEQAGIDLDAPYLNAGSEDGYALG